MGAISDRMDGDLRLRGLSEVTRAEYRRCACQFVAHYMLRLDRSEAYLREILGAITARYGSQVTWNALRSQLSIDHPKTIADYCGLLVRMDVLAVVPALQEHSLSASPKKARKLHFTDPFIHHAVRMWLKQETRPLAPADVIDDPVRFAADVEASLVTHLARGYPTA